MNAVEFIWDGCDIVWEGYGEAIVYKDGCYTFVLLGQHRKTDSLAEDVVPFDSEDEFLEWLGVLRSDDDPEWRGIEAAVGKYWGIEDFVIIPDVPIVTGMARGVVYLDENLEELEPYLKKRKFRVRTPTSEGYKRTDDPEIAALFLSNHIFITNNAVDFIAPAIKYDFGIIEVPQKLLADPDKAAWAISRAVIDNSVWSLRQPFKVVLRVDGTSHLVMLKEPPKKRQR